ncbi:MAG: cyclic nucleotide-binding domain-containing protein, partial [Candidatus Binatia bacterium]
GVLRPGDSFGEAALLDDGFRTATVRASGNCEVLRLDRQRFDELVAAYPEVRASLELQARQRNVINFFRQNHTFARLPPAVILDLVARLERVSVEAGALVVCEGDELGPMHVVEKGKLRMFAGAGSGRHDVAFLRTGDFFGEDSLLRGARRAFSVEAVSPCRLLALSREDFDALAEKSSEFRVAMEERVAQFEYRRTAKVPLDFATELLPADATAPPAVSEDQVDREEGESEEAPFASSEGHFLRKPGRIRRFPFVRQVDEMDCGAAALAMVCRHFGRRVSLGRIRQLVHTSIDGTSLRGICSAASDLGLAARSVKASRANLAKMPLPAIVHWQGNHWVVLYGLQAHRRHPAQARRQERAGRRDRW